MATLDTSIRQPINDKIERNSSLVKRKKEQERENIQQYGRISMIIKIKKKHYM